MRRMCDPKKLHWLKRTNGWAIELESSKNLIFTDIFCELLMANVFNTGGEIIAFGPELHRGKTSPDPTINPRKQDETRAEMRLSKHSMFCANDVWAISRLPCRVFQQIIVGSGEAFPRWSSGANAIISPPVLKTFAKLYISC